MWDNWFVDPQASAMALQDALHRAVPERELTRAAMRMLLTRMHLDAQTLAQLSAAGMGVADLREAAARLEAQLRQDRGPLGVIARAVAHLLSGMGRLGDLAPGEDLDRAVGLSIVRALTGALFPLTGEKPDPRRQLRWAASEILAFREVSGGTLEALDRSDRLHLAQRLEEGLPLMAAVVPPAGHAALTAVVARASALLKQEPPVEADAMNAAIAPVA